MGRRPSPKGKGLKKTKENSALLSGFLSKRQVLKLIPISDVTLWTWCRTGYFPAPRVMGSKTVWLASEVSAFIESRPLREYKKEG
jgi:predicted DNA-binding transcriptional regulator AlpA